ncbi:MAG: hypothetical protein ACLSWI_03270 [Candidatus Gastranaerophilaceae bacterium]
MAQQFNAQNIKKRLSVLVFLKGSTAPLVLYVENPEELYAELIQAIKSSAAMLIERETQGPLKKVAFISNQIASVAIQEEQYV